MCRGLPRSEQSWKLFILAIRPCRYLRNTNLRLTATCFIQQPSCRNHRHADHEPCTSGSVVPRIDRGQHLLTCPKISEDHANSTTAPVGRLAESGNAQCIRWAL